MFRTTTSTCNKRRRYFPLVVHAICQNPQVPGYSYSRILYFEFNTSSAEIRLIQQKVLTNDGVFTLEEAYGLNSNRTDANDGQRECVICLTNDKNTLAKPCKHVSACFGCAQVIMASNRQCPICRQEISEIIPLDISS